jgi:hypothetical protein
MNQMYEDANGVMVPDSTMLREIHHVFHYGVAETVTELFPDEWDGVTGPINEAPCLEPIDNDPTINALLAAEDL